MDLLLEELLGTINYASINLCGNEGNIKGSNNGYSTQSGGICGEERNSTIIKNSYNLGNVLTEKSSGSFDSYTGGIVGIGSAFNCYNIGNVTNVVNNTKSNYAGGISGEGGVKNCYNFGNIMAENGIKGGVIGHCYRDSEFVGYYYKTNLINSNLETAIGNMDRQDGDTKMLGYFTSIDATSFTYTNSTSETSGYSGNLLTKLNKWVTDNQTNNSDYSTWKMDEDDDCPVFSWQ